MNGVRHVVLGAGGFLGINLVRRLEHEPGELICFDRSPGPQWPARARTILGDFSRPPDALLDVLDNAVVYHLVSSGKPSQVTAPAARELVTDVAGTLHCLEATRGRSLRWVFFSSGGTVYGPDAPCPIPESAPTRPICAYGIAKLTIERYLDLYRTLHGTDYVVARIANPYGPWQDPQRGQGIIPALIYKALRGEPIEIWGDGENIRDYLHVDDVTDATLGLARHGRNGETYNIGSGQGVSINHLLEAMRDCLDYSPSVTHTPARSVDVRRSVLDIDKIQHEIGWAPRISLHDGLRSTAAWIARHMLPEQ